MSVPVPDRRIGSEVVDLAIPLQGEDAVVHGVAFHRPGPISGTVVGGVSVVVDDSSKLVESARNGTAFDAEAIARGV